jgi:hypothetical protein
MEAGSKSAQQDRDTAGVGDTALGIASAAPSGAPTSEPGVRVDMPGKRLPRQKRPPCSPRWEVEINGGCWLQHTVKAPCGAGEYERQGRCYMPVEEPERPATSEQP